jgi:PTH1 family peptidyl-tRNA hydrolase
MPDHIIVVCDDVNLSLGKIRIRKYGSSGGHNGIKSLIQFLRSDNFPRVRLGVGSPADDQRLENFVLDKFTHDELTLLDPSIEKACDAIQMIIENEIENAMNLFNE